MVCYSSVGMAVDHGSNTNIWTPHSGVVQVTLGVSRACSYHDDTTALLPEGKMPQEHPPSDTGNLPKHPDLPQGAWCSLGCSAPTQLPKYPPVGPQSALKMSFASASAAASSACFHCAAVAASASRFPQGRRGCVLTLLRYTDYPPSPCLSTCCAFLSSPALLGRISFASRRLLLSHVR